MTHEKELTAPVELCDGQGRLNPDAVGFSRRPLHVCNLPERWGRKKRWDYWCVTSAECALSVTYADLDYLGFASVSLIDFESTKTTDKVFLVPLARGFSQPQTVNGGDVVFSLPGFHFALRPQPRGIRIICDSRTILGKNLEADVFVEFPADHETLNVVIPWSAERFQFTSKQNTLPARGCAQAGKRRYEFSEENRSFGCLDYGRGIWPFRTHWNWASASGVVGGRTVGLQFGGKWTAGTGMTENGLCVGGRLSKIGEELSFDYDTRNFKKPWRIETPSSDQVRLDFTPFLVRKLWVPLGPVGADAHICFGRYSGAIRTDTAERVEIRDLIGWAEEMIARW